MEGMDNKPLIEIKPESARLYLFIKMEGAGHTPASLAKLMGISRQAVSQLLHGIIQPGPEILKALGLRWTYVVENPQAKFEPGPLFEEVQARRNLTAATGPIKKESATKKTPAKKKTAKPKEGK